MVDKVIGIFVAVLVIVIATLVHALVTHEEEIIEIEIEGNVTKIVKYYSNNDYDYWITFDCGKTYYFGEDNFEWELGKYYSMTIWKYKGGENWNIDSYLVSSEELHCN